MPTYHIQTVCINSASYNSVITMNGVTKGSVIRATSKQLFLVECYYQLAD